MVEPDTVKLLRECDAGIKMGVTAIDEVLEYVHRPQLEQTLSESKSAHEKLKSELQQQLCRCHDGGKEPNPIAKGMSWAKTNVKLAAQPTDQTIAGLITDGCDMGIKSLNKYLNQYKAADENAKDLAKRLIRLEEDLARDVRGYL